ncbi:MAG: GNAT family N-acetyltransferase [Chthoniobacterales bacterium]
MIEWLKRAFSEPDRFSIPPGRHPLPECRFREFNDADYDTCVAIYSLNEPGRFPAGYLDLFSKWLRSRSDLLLMCEVEGEVRGFGGIHMLKHPDGEVAGLSNGMIHPDSHKQGYGTALLLARLATLPSPQLQWQVFLSTAGGSETFYRRFRFVPSQPFTDERGTKFDLYRTRVYRPDWEACRDALAAASVAMDTADAVVPMRQIPAPGG